MEAPAVGVFLDTDALIDCLRGTPAANAWLDAAGDQQFEIPGIAAMELLCGCRNQVEVHQASIWTCMPGLR